METSEVIMDDERYFTGKTKFGIVVYIGPITTEQLRDADIGGSSTGYYFCEIDEDDPIGGLSVLGSFHNPEAAYRTAQILGLHNLKSPIADFEDPLLIENL
jgi:hypothetical protein